jgi:(1->4)-alpha-D-glucan 1-alpha-D-glucosylmutase
MQSDTKTATRTAAGAADRAGGRVPRATYRVQFNPDFTFADARALVRYLNDLGVSDLYASPLFTARAGSTHGYDVVDYGALNPALGGEPGFKELSRELRRHGLGLLLDIVPNHMGIGPDNPWWTDVLENGQSSEYAAFFDIDWQPAKPELHGKVLLPMLGDQYGVVLERGELQLSFDAGAFCLNYYQTCLPLAPRSYLHVLTPAADLLAQRLAEGHADRDEFLSIITAIRNLPQRDEQDPALLAERRREKEVIKRRLAALCDVSQEVHVALAATIRTLNGTPGKPRSFDRLHDLIDDQPYRLAFWRVAAEEINYRRFFDINELAAVRVELPEVFEAMHALVMRLAAEGHVTGLRIDHPDGLWDPPAYFRQLQEAYRAAVEESQEPGTKNQEPENLVLGSWFSVLPFYVVAEKILSEREPLPADWAVAGTTGYDFLNAANGLFVDRRAERTIDAIYRRFIAPEDPAGVPRFEDLVHDSKQLIMQNALASELRSLAHQLERVNEKNRRYRDFTLQGLTGALSDIISAMAIYRTYITGPETVADRDRRYITAAVREARRRHPRTARSLFAFLEDTLLLRNLREFRTEDHADVVRFVMRFQQITGPIMAKSVEDTAFYSYNRLSSLNEVGGAPEHFGSTPAEFHRQNAERARDWPHAMLSATTHDTKRSEDTRARINVLAELPGEWEQALERWSTLNERHKQEVDGDPAPDRNDEYLLYQTLLGTWPFADLQYEPHRNAERGTLNAEQAAAEGNAERGTPNAEQVAADGNAERGTLNAEQAAADGNAERGTLNAEQVAADGNAERGTLNAEQVAADGNAERGTLNAEQVAADAQPRQKSGTASQAEHFSLQPSAFSLYKERIAAYMQKATKEAKRHTSWINPNEEYDAAVHAFVEALLADTPDNQFVHEILPLARRVAFFGRYNSLAQTLLRLTSPGVPDVYQGAELWDLSLVDPDNRRPVDFALVAGMLKDVRRRARGKERAALAADLLANSADGRIKLYLTAEALDLRRRHGELFADGDYHALEAQGAKAAHVVAFARTLEDQAIITVVPRLVVGLTDGEELPPVGAVWGDTQLTLNESLPSGRYRDVLTAKEYDIAKGLALSDLLATLPVALLELVGS